MAQIEITRFKSGRSGYTKADSSKVPLDRNDRATAVIQYVENAICQLRHGQGEPRGISFASYTGVGGRNLESKIEGVYALGSGLIGYSQKMTVAASATAEKKTVGQRS
ncbi:hypothetical protein FHS94_002686 [Sphingomonas aerophila]|uniref:Uncharacterized protein n=1 Tax=Sphingomonas aerophila TaxID=1344948 RepID=A0A7W9BF80_9SPHN|nr:hypothetical protein [Sphingomonas aerophila]